MIGSAESFDFCHLPPTKFEEVTFLLALLREPTLVKTADPDLGLDAVVLGAHGGPALRGFQAKRFTGDIKWSQCRESLDAAVENYGVAHLTFTFPVDLTGKRIKKFELELVGRHPGVHVDFWGASTLTALLVGSEEGERVARYIFGVGEYERLARLTRARGDLDTTGQAISLMGATSDRFRDDPYFRYSLTTRPLSVPGPMLAPGALMRFEVTEDAVAHHIDVHATEAALAADMLPRGQLQFVGDDAIRRFQEFLRVGGRLEVEDARLSWERQPKYIAELVGDADETRVRLESERRLQPRPMIVEVDTASGPLSMELDMQATAPPAGWHHALVGDRAGTAVQILVRERDTGGGELRLNWTWRFGGSPSAVELLLGLQVLEAAEDGAEVRVRDCLSGDVLAAGALGQTFDDTLRTVKQVLEDLVALEAWLGHTIHVPDQISGAEAGVIFRAARLIEGTEGSWSRVEFTLAIDPGLDRIVPGGVICFREEVSIELFGRRYDLGVKAAYLDGIRVSETASVDGARRLVLEPASPGSRALIRLERSPAELRAAA